MRGGRIYCDTPTVTGTENLMMAAITRGGSHRTGKCGKRTGDLDLADFLVKRGARIQGAGTDVITIEGVRSLHGGDHEVIPDRIEAGTYLAAGALTHGDVTATTVGRNTLRPC